MTKLSPEQEQLLAEVAEAKRTVDINIMERRVEFEAGVEKDKAPIYNAIAEAVYAGVPTTRIGVALGTKDHKTIKSYFPPKDAMTIRNEGVN